MGGRIRLSFQDKPGHINPCKRETLVLLESQGGRVHGVGGRKVLDVWYDGRKAQVGYLHRFRGESRIGWNFKSIKQGFDMLLDSRTDNQLDFDVTSIASDNTAARRLLERNLPGMPIYHPLCGYTTFVLTTRRSGTVSSDSEPMDDTVIAEIESLQQQYASAIQFAPSYSMVRLLSVIPAQDWILVRRGGRIVAAAGMWNQPPTEQIRVAGYDSLLSAMRPLHNVLARLLNKPTLPPADSNLPMAFLAFAAFDSPHPSDVLLLIRRAMLHARNLGLAYLAFGATEGAPLYRIALKHFRPWKFATTIYAVTRSGRQTVDGIQRAASVGLEAALL